MTFLVVLVVLLAVVVVSDGLVQVGLVLREPTALLLDGFALTATTLISSSNRFLSTTYEIVGNKSSMTSSGG